jgi:hypothetical protein
MKEGGLCESIERVRQARRKKECIWQESNENISYNDMHNNINLLHGYFKLFTN